jgi:hypothetical protein
MTVFKIGDLVVGALMIFIVAGLVYQGMYTLLSIHDIAHLRFN